MPKVSSQCSISSTLSLEDSFLVPQSPIQFKFEMYTLERLELISKKLIKNELSLYHRFAQAYEMNMLSNVGGFPSHIKVLKLLFIFFLSVFLLQPCVFFHFCTCTNLCNPKSFAKLRDVSFNKCTQR